MVGPGVGVPVLKGRFPDIPRREIEDLLDRYRRFYVHRNARLVNVLTWHRPGAVWAMDYTDPPLPIDGVYPAILAVRDLGSARTLLSLPAEGKTASVARSALKALFLEHGPPLVLKSDRGSHFTAEVVQDALAGANVLPLWSPVRTPSYNGSAEAGIGALKTRIHHEAARHGRPGEWTCDDVEAARLLAEETARPWGAKGPTPREAWTARVPLSDKERQDFQDTVQKLESDRLGSGEPETIERDAIRRALVAHGFLSIRRRLVRLPIAAALRDRFR
jgi:transposase InsO family protein